MALKVFISSRMAELRDVREIVGKALTDRSIEAFVYEECAGARPETVVTTSLREVEKADVYVGLFWHKYGEVTVEEYGHARKHNKPCFVYIRDKDLRREPKLEAFLKAEVYDLAKGVTYDYFNSALQLGDAVARDVMAWLEHRHRELSAKEREKYDNSMKTQNLGAARMLHEQSALRKLKSSDISRARIGIQEIASLGADLPFEKGFNALATQLARRRSWLLKFEIVEALTVVAKPIREQY